MPIKVFVVDDERIIADSLTAILNMSGYEARAFYDGESALSACAIGCPQCIISDVVMPGINGVEMAIQIRRQFPECKVLLISGQAVTIDILEAAGADGQEFEVLQKPVHPKDLIARLEMRNLEPPRRKFDPSSDEKLISLKCVSKTSFERARF